MTTRHPENVRILHPSGTTTPVEVEYLGTEPRAVDGEIYIVERYAIKGTFLAKGDRIEADWMPSVCSFVAMCIEVGP